jgi:hypothetical protein
MPRAGLEPSIPATKRPQAYALDRAATGIGYHWLIYEGNSKSKVPYLLFK